ncbi:MAG: DNA-protecting protein DprA [Bacteroidota bacterium]
MHAQLIYQIALTLVPQVGDVHARTLVQTFGDAASVFNARKRELELVEGIGSVRAASIKRFDNFIACETEIHFIEKYKITPLYFTDPQYPQRLLNCYDCPSLLYFRGNAPLNQQRIVAVIGTRNNSDYGKQVCEQIIAELATENILVVSGLALGIDTIAHKAALKNQLETVGVLAHGLDRIYPVSNKSLARQMIEQGGLLTEFRSASNPDKQNFPKRNRIVAGISDLVLVIETGIKGGSMITAELANSYNRDVFALPGNIYHPQSEGCHYLIRSNKASLVTSAADVCKLMNWKQTKPHNQQIQRQLFIELNPAEQQLYNILQQREAVHIDELFYKSNMSSSAVAAGLLSLELQGVVISLPGKLYRIN